MTLSELLAHRAATAGGETALTWPAATLTWGQLDRRVTAAAAALRRVTEPGQRSAILVPPSPEYVVAFLGALRAGLVAIPLGPDGRTRVLADAEPSIVLATSASVRAIRHFLATSDTCGHRVLAVDAAPDAPGCTGDPVAPSDVAYLQYPGGVMVTHANVVANARQAAQVPAASTVVSPLPPSDPLGLVLGVAVPIVTGRPVTIDESAPGALPGCYVVAEATALVPCGHPAGQEVAIVGRDGRRVPAGDAGEIWVSGPNVARGYWRRPEESARVFCARITGDDEPRWWLRTGDQGFLTPSGELCVTGRDLVAGYRPADLEATAEQAHPAIRPHASAAFAVRGDQAVLVLELADGVVPPRGDSPKIHEVERAVRHAVSARHGLTLRRVVVRPSSAGDGLW
ncbi:AMP-binding protein [Amycolatopsis sp. cmx-4-61]|uniref:AMP-binding protein n=1 Tax=Amycolatopsis sp. cmx-4-61 TaxID=2790937 RepID=UPI00397CD4B6